MKKLFALTLLIMLFSVTVQAQTGWFQQNSGTTQSFESVYFINDQTGFVAGGFKIYKTTNGGTSWNQNILSDTTTLTAIRFLNNTTGYACGGRTVNQYYCVQHLFKTTNTGETWIKIYQLSTSFTYFDLFRDVFPIDNLLYLTRGGWSDMGSTGGMYLSQNGGTNFTGLNVSYEESINKMSFINSQTGWVTTRYSTDVPYSKSKIFKTTNSGQNWLMQFRDSTVNTYLSSKIEVQFLNQNTGYGLYRREYSVNIARFLKTSNGGTAWDSTTLPYNISNAMFFADASTGWICGGSYPDSILIIRTTNSGSNWHSQKKGNISLSAIYFVNNLTGWAVGYNGIILKTVTGGVTGVQNISTEVPSDYSLSQNYPNPFNPVTKIRLEIPSREGWTRNADGVGLVTLKVFDVAGREIQTLVNEMLQPGSYEVTFDGTALNSGVYFYQLMAGSYRETRRMVLLK